MSVFGVLPNWIAKPRAGLRVAGSESAREQTLLPFTVIRHPAPAHRHTLAPSDGVALCGA